MYRVQTLNQIAAAGLARLPQNRFQVENDAEAPDAILVRSASLHEKELPDSLLAIARAGAGVNNIPLDRCSEKGIVVFNTPGANSGAVAELTIGALIMGSRNLTAANAWLNGLKGKDVDLAKEVEKGKKQFVGPELHGKKLGVIGLGAIGVKVANDAVHLGMEVYGYDPYISVEAAWNLSRSVVHCVNLSEVLSKCDYLTLHIPVTPQTKGFLASLFGGGEPQAIDCDASALLLQDGKLRNWKDVVYFGALRHGSGAVQHMGDNLTGAGEGDDEQIIIELDKVPAQYDRIVVVVNIFRAEARHQHFGMIENAFIRIVDARNNQELCRFNLSEHYDGMTAMIFGEVYRHGNEWKFNAIGQATTDPGLESLSKRYQ